MAIHGLIHSINEPFWKPSVTPYVVSFWVRQSLRHAYARRVFPYAKQIEETLTRSPYAALRKWGFCLRQTRYDKALTEIKCKGVFLERLNWTPKFITLIVFWAGPRTAWHSQTWDRGAHVWRLGLGSWPFQKRGGCLEIDGNIPSFMWVAPSQIKGPGPGAATIIRIPDPPVLRLTGILPGQ